MLRRQHLPPFFAEPSLKEHALLDRVMQCSGATSGSELSGPQWADIASQHGLDFATAAMFCQVATQPECFEVLTRLTELMAGNAAQRPICATLVVVPGAFYREIAKSGGDGRKIREQAAQLGCETALIPCESMGTLAANSRIILHWLKTRKKQFPAERIILASLSKGSADISFALQHDSAEAAFANVAAWLNLSGVPLGSPVVNWYQQRPVKWWLHQQMFKLRGLDFEIVRQLEWGSNGHLPPVVNTPPHIKMLTVAGFPLRAHASHFILRSYRQKMLQHGPSDGVALLADAASLPGVLVPVWGADHYLRPRWDTARLIRAMAVYLAGELNLFTSAR